MTIYFYDGSMLSCETLDPGADGMIADEYRLVDLSEVVRIVAN